MTKAQPTPAKSKAQLAYEADLIKRPNYHDGTPRRAWDEISEIAQWSWEPDA